MAKQLEAEFESGELPPGFGLPVAEYYSFVDLLAELLPATQHHFCL